MKRILILLIKTVFLSFPLLAAAQSGGIPDVLSPPAVENGTDLAIQYLQDIFGVVDGVLHGSGSQIMGAMFTAFNAGALILGGMIIFYTMLVSTLNTAHQGEILGKSWSSMWIPVKSAAGIALLLPKATGYSIIQIFMMWSVVQGVALADTIWDSALAYLMQGGVIVQQQLAPQSGMVDTVANVLTSEVCMYGLQDVLTTARQQYLQQNPGTSVEPVPLFLSTIVPINVTSDPAQYPACLNPDGSYKKPCVSFPGGSATNPNYSTATYGSLNGLCGQISWNPPSSSGPAAVANMNSVLNVSQAQTIAVQQIILGLSGPAQNIVNVMLQHNNGAITVNTGIDLTSILQKKMLYDTVQDYQGIIMPLYMQLAGGGGSGIIPRAIYDQASSQGWITAGVFYHVLAATNDALFSSVLSPPSTTDKQGIMQSLNTNLSSKLPKWAQSYSDVIAQLVSSSNLASYISTAKSTKYNINAGLASEEPGANTALVGNILQQAVGRGAGLGEILDSVAGPIIGPLIGIINAFVALGLSQITNFNPVLALALLGNSLIDLVVNVWVVGGTSAGVVTGALGAIPCVTLSNAVNSVLMWIIPLLWSMLGLLFVNGCLMAFYIPMIPFILFAFGSIGWLMAVVEAMVAAPIVALGITHPEGHEVLGKSDPAVMLLVNVFLRPSMMIIGFIAGIILSYVGVWLINQGFFEAMALSVASSLSVSASIIFIIPAVLIMYTVIVIAVINQAFAMINVVPDRVLRWIGGQPESISEMAKAGLGEVQAGMKEGMGELGKGIGTTQQAKGGRADKLGKATATTPGGGGGAGGGGPPGGGAGGGGGMPGADQLQMGKGPEGGGGPGAPGGGEGGPPKPPGGGGG
ncbi:MAG: type IVB secretion system protein DotA [Gammaproteobacteria bacterium]